MEVRLNAGVRGVQLALDSEDTTSKIIVINLVWIIVPFMNITKAMPYILK